MLTYDFNLMNFKSLSQVLDTFTIKIVCLACKTGQFGADQNGGWEPIWGGVLYAKKEGKAKSKEKRTGPKNIMRS